MIDIARENRGQTDATQRTLLAESYFGLKLAQEVVRVRQETYNLSLTTVCNAITRMPLNWKLPA